MSFAWPVSSRFSPTPLAVVLTGSFGISSIAPASVSCSALRKARAGGRLAIRPGFTAWRAVRG